MTLFIPLAALPMTLAMMSLPAAAATALEIHPPDGFTAKQSSPDADAVTTFEVTTNSDPDTGCSVEFVPMTGADRPHQSQINSAAAMPSYLARVKADLEKHFDVKSIQPFSMQGAPGAVATGNPKVAKASRSSIFVVEVPRGKLQVACIAYADEFEHWRPLFEKVARGVVLPR